MTELPVPRRDVRRIYSDLADDVSRREQQLAAELPVDGTAGVPDRLRKAIDNWESGRKSIRTVPAINVYARHCEESVPDSITRTMTGLDALINVLDDIIDTQHLTTQEKVTLTLNAAFSSVLTAESCPSEARGAVRDILLDYFTAVFQIPLVERDLFERMTTARGSHRRRNAAEAFYAYRSRDIDAFANLPATVMDIDPETNRRLRHDLRAYRARRLLFKDIKDVERDIADDDVTPVIHFLRHFETTNEVVEAIEDLHARFTYSDAGHRCYGDVLQDLEKPPGDLPAVIRKTRRAVAVPPRP